MKSYMERIRNGILNENPIFILMLGICPTLAVTTSASNGLGMGLTTTAVLTGSNAAISALRKKIPDRVRMPAYIVVVASFVTIVQFLLEAYLPELNKTLGIYIPLIVVNCIILGRAESYAAKNPVGLSICDGIGMGLGFSVGLVAIGALRELIGNGSIFNWKVTPTGYEPVTIFILAPGAFFVLAGLTALQNKFKVRSATNVPGREKGCLAACAGCNNPLCAPVNGYEEATRVAEKAMELQDERGKEKHKKGDMEKDSDVEKIIDIDEVSNIEEISDMGNTSNAEIISGRDKDRDSGKDKDLAKNPDAGKTEKNRRRTP